MNKLKSEKKLIIMPEDTRLFEDHGKLEQVAKRATVGLCDILEWSN